MIRKYSAILALILLVMSGCTPKSPTQPSITPTPSTQPSVTLVLPSAESQESTTTPPSDTIPPSSITGLIANNAYDGRVNIWWDKGTAEDFGHYNIYIAKTEIVDVTGMQPIKQIEDINTLKYQATELEDGIKYYVAVTAVDENSNENMQVYSASVTPTPMPRGIIDTALAVDIYQSDRTWAGTTLLADNHDLQRRRIIEINMLGEIIWEYVVSGVPQNSFIEAQLLASNNVLYTVSEKGVYEVDRSGKIVWSYLTSKIDHDAQRLPNGDTIFVFGMNDQKDDAQVVEVNINGEVVWSWYAKDYFDKVPYADIFDVGWTHTNAVIRLSNGNTLISLRNFDMVAEVNPQGAVVRNIGEGILIQVHGPEILPNGNIVAALPNQQSLRTIEIDPKSGVVVWQFNWEGDAGARDANRLPNGNTLVVGLTKILEVTNEGEIAWQLSLTANIGQDKRLQGFYKADRISAQ